MDSSTPYLDAISSHLPTELSHQLGDLIPTHSELLDNIIRFSVGAELQLNFSESTRKEWIEKQPQAREMLDSLLSPEQRRLKREREEDIPTDSKRQKVVATVPTDDSPALYTLQSVSTTSPLRKKLNISISLTSITFTNPSTNAVESSVPLSSLTRAFIVPTRGKQKPHYTVIILSSDTRDPKAPQTQIIFGVDAIATTALNAETTKGQPTLPALKSFLSHSTIPTLEPDVQYFKSAKNNGNIPAAGIEAYRGAKNGTLWFFDSGILWGEAKPCEYWPVEELINKNEGLRMVSATGRTCSVILTRKGPSDEQEGEEEDLGIETEFGMVDGKEQEPINAWVRTRKNLFGKERVVAANINANGAQALNGAIAAEDSDESDEDFAVDSDDSDGGSASSDSDSEEEETKSGSEAEASDSDLEEENAEDTPLDPARHPLMRPGAMPRMSKATMDMVVGMVEDDMMGVHADAEGEDERDELEMEDD